VIDNKYTGYIIISDEIKEDSDEIKEDARIAIQRLKDIGVKRQVMLIFADVGVALLAILNSTRVLK